MSGDTPETTPPKPTLRFDRMLFIVLAAALLAAALAVTIQMLKPSNRGAVVQALVQDGQGIISAAQTWAANLPADVDTTGGPFTHLRFDRIGYMDGLSPDARAMVNEHGRFTLVVAPPGSTFTLDAVGADGIAVQWSDIGEEGIPKPVVK